MKRLPLLVIITFLASLAGCDRTVVRDARVFELEMGFMEQAAVQQAELLEDLFRSHPECECVDGKLPNSSCEDAAKTMLVAKIRVPWHKQMALFNAGLLEERPSEEPPSIPDPHVYFCSEAEEVSMLISL